MWVQGDETYLAARTAVGLSNISLHSSGQWFFAAGTGRSRINGPRKLIDHWAAGPRIVFPGVPPLFRLATFKDPIHRDSLVYESPPENHWRDFAVLFSEPSADPNDIVTLLPPNSEAIGPISLRSRGSSWLATFLTPMTPEQVSYISAERGKFRVTVRGGVESLRAPWATLIQDAANGDTMIINIELGRENIETGIEMGDR